MQYLESSFTLQCLFSIPGKIFATFVEVHLKHLSLFLFEGLSARILSQLKNTHIDTHFFGEEGGGKKRHCFLPKYGSSEKGTLLL